MIDRRPLEHLGPLERVNCVYCGYANGVLGYAREIAARTEQSRCPIKHARRVLGIHDRHAAFMEYGEAKEFQDVRDTLRSALEAESEDDSSQRQALMPGQPAGSAARVPGGPR